MTSRSPSKRSFQNLMEKIPEIKVDFRKESENKITVILPRKNNLFNRFLFRVYHLPKERYLHLDEIWSHLFMLIDGKRNVTDIVERMKESFPDDIKSIQIRTASMLEILEVNRIIDYIK